MDFHLFVAVVAGVLVVGSLVSLARKGRVAGAQIGRLRREVHTPVDPQAAFDRISAMRGTFHVDDADASAQVVVLASSLSPSSFGFLYPVFIHADGGGSRIEVGCHSKFLVMGSIRSSWHNRCVAAIEATLGPAAGTRGAIR